MILKPYNVYSEQYRDDHQSTNTKYNLYIERSPSTWLLLKCNGHLAESIGRLDAHMCIYVYLSHTHANRVEFS